MQSLSHQHKQLQIISLQEAGNIDVISATSGASFLSFSLAGVSVASILLNILNICYEQLGAWER